MKRKWISCLTILLAALMLLSSCSPASGKPGETKAPVEATEPETKPGTEPETVPETEPETEPATEPETEPETEPGNEALEILAKVTETMNALKEFRYEQQTEANFVVENMVVASQQGIELAVSGADTEDPYFSYREMNITAMEALGMASMTGVGKEYLGGTLYTAQVIEDGKDTVSFREAMPFDQAFDQDAWANAKEGYVIKEDEITSIRAEKEGDGWVITAEMSLEAAEEMEGYEDMVSMLGKPTSAVQILHTDAGFHATQVGMSVSFPAVKGIVPTICISASYSEYDAVKRPDTIDEANFGELLTAEEAQETLDRYLSRSEETSGSFVYVFQNKIAIAGSESVQNETDTVSYAITDGKITFDCTAVTDATEFVLRYADGEQTVIVDGNEQINPWTDEAALELIMQLLFPTPISLMTPSVSVRNGENEITVYYAEAAPEACTAYMESLSCSYESSESVSHYFTDADGSIVRAEHVLYIVGFYQGQAVTVTNTYQISFGS